MQKLERLASMAGIVAVFGCASSTAPTETPQSPPPPSEPASGSSSSEATDMPAPASSEPAAPGGDKTGDNEGKWEGEEKAAAAGKPVERTAAETRTTEVIQKIVLDHRQPVRDCYDKARKELPDLRGKLVIKFTLDPEGNVKKAELDVAGSDIKAPAVSNCAIDAIKKIKFPPSSRGMDTTVNYPFDFKPDGAARPASSGPKPK